MLNQVINQWGSNLRKAMTLTRYLQLYGIQDVAIYTFASIPVESIADVLKSECKECYLTNYNQ